MRPRDVLKLVFLRTGPLIEGTMDIAPAVRSPTTRYTFGQSFSTAAETTRRDAYCSCNETKYIREQR